MTGTFDASWRRAYLKQLRRLLPQSRSVELDLLPLDQTLRALGHDGEQDLGSAGGRARCDRRQR